VTSKKTSSLDIRSPLTARIAIAGAGLIYFALGLAGILVPQGGRVFGACLAVFGLLSIWRGLYAGVRLSTAAFTIHGYYRNKRIPIEQVTRFRSEDGPVGLYRRSYLVVDLRSGDKALAKMINSRPGRLDPVVLRLESTLGEIRSGNSLGQSPT